MEALAGRTTALAARRGHAHPGAGHRPAAVDPVINDHLGDAYWRTGRKLEATFQWNHARDLKPEPEDLPKILEKIQNGLPDEPRPASAETVETKANGG